MRKLFVLIGLFLFICLPSMAQSGITQLSDNSYDNDHPQINNSGQVVWDDGEGEIFFYNGTTTIQLTDNSYGDRLPQINNSGQVVWMGEGPSGTDEEIFFYNGTTTIQLTDNDYNDLYPQINISGQVVWQGCDGADCSIFLYTPSPTPDIKANGSDGPVTVSSGNPFTLTGQLNSGDMSGQNADWWVGVNIASSPPDDWYHYDLFLGWMPGIIPTYQGPLFELNPYDVSGMSGLPIGTYTFYFAVDTVMNGSIDMGQIYYDSVDVTIVPYFQANLLEIDPNYFYENLYAKLVDWADNLFLK
jgi:hypothetical protein